MSDRPAPRLFLVRHGETEWSLSGQHTGLKDIPLTDRGRAAAARLRERFAGESFAHVLTSPLSRAKVTCGLAGFGERAEVDPDLVEWDYGRYEGLTSHQIKRERPEWNLFRDGAPDGESPAAASARADRFLARVAALDADTIAFSSGHFIRTLAARWLGLPITAARGFYTATASVGVLGYEHGRLDRVILLWNDIRP